MEKLWFIYSNELVSGPYTTDRVKNDYLEGRWSTDAQVWWKGSKEWLSIDSWYHNLTNIIEAARTNGQHAVWYAEQNGNQKGPLTKSDLISYLKTLSDVSSVRLWTVGKNHWANLFEFHEIISQLGLSKRNFDRAPIIGNVTILKNGESIKKQLASVSGGGIGIKNGDKLNVGETLTVSISSPHLNHPVRANAKVMYIEPNGFAGLQFQNIHVESKITLMDYVRNFNSEDSSEPSRLKKAS